MKSSSPLAPNFTSSLLAWYDANARAMPWRVPPGAQRGERPDPYAVLVSEVMLQQTTVKAVLPYFRDWMERFPTVQDLAKADAQTVLRQWEGLGYYSRARNLHASAMEVVSRYGGKVPQEAAILRSLPGVGQYTAGAVASIAFGLPVPALDANSRRVWSRLLAASSRGRILSVFARIVPALRPGDFNQALMDLGAAVCTSRNPLCGQCPLAHWCRSLKHEEASAFPPAKKKNPPVAVEAALGILFHNGKVLVQKRAEEGLFAGMWEFPGGKVERVKGEERRAKKKPFIEARKTKIDKGQEKRAETPEVALLREFREETGLAVAVSGKLGVFRHSYTRFSVTLHVFMCKKEGGRLSRRRCARWVTLEELDALPMPAANRRIAEKLRERIQGLGSWVLAGG